MSPTVERFTENIDIFPTLCEAMGVPVRRLFTAVFGIGAGLCAVAGALLATGLANQPIEWLLFSRFSVVLAFVLLAARLGAVRAALESGDLNPARWQAWLKLRDELAAAFLADHGRPPTEPEMIALAQRAKDGGA